MRTVAAPRYAPANCAAVIDGFADPLSCTELALSTGHWKYTVTPVLYGWHGTESSRSALVVVSPNAPTSASLANGLGAGGTYVSSSNVGAVSIDVALPATSLASDTVHVTLDDGHGHTASGSHAATAGAGTVHVTGIDASALTDGSITITAKVTSAQGDDSGDTTGSFVLDTTAPHVIVTADRAPDSNGWFNHTVTFSAATSTDNSGIQSCDADIVYSGPDTAAGLQALQCLDNAGNIGSGSLAFKYDKTRPSTGAAVAPIIPNGSNGWYSTAPTYTLTPTDATSGVAATSYAIGGGSTQVYSGPFTLPDGSYTITRWSVDVAGNTESNKTSGTLKVDTVAPSTTLTFNPATPNGNNGWYDGSSPTFTLSATDATSGVASTSYRIDGGSAHAYSGAVTIPDGVHTISYWSVDVAGNVENAGSGERQGRHRRSDELDRGAPGLAGRRGRLVRHDAHVHAVRSRRPLGPRLGQVPDRRRRDADLRRRGRDPRRPAHDHVLGSRQRRQRRELPHHGDDQGRHGQAVDDYRCQPVVA